MENKEKIFCEMYAFGLNGTAAAIMAGYDPAVAVAVADELLGTAEIRAQIEIEKEIKEKLDAAVVEDVRHMVAELEAMR